MGVQQDSWDLGDQAARGKGNSVRCVSVANASSRDIFQSGRRNIEVKQKAANSSLQQLSS